MFVGIFLWICSDDNKCKDDDDKRVMMIANLCYKKSNHCIGEDLYVCFLPANTTDLLQPMDISVNKSVKSFSKGQCVGIVYLSEAFQVDYVIKINHKLSNNIRVINNSMC